MDKYLIISDLDNTLLNNKRKISLLSKIYIKKLILNKKSIINMDYITIKNKNKTLNKYEVAIITLNIFAYNIIVSMEKEDLHTNYLKSLEIDKTFKDFKKLDEEELKLVEEVADELKARTQNGCTGCAYCMPCPADVNIPKVFAMWNNSYKYGWKDHHYYGLKNEGHGADKCVSCGKCMEVCPQQLKIPELLAEAKGYFEN